MQADLNLLKPFIGLEGGGEGEGEEEEGQQENFQESRIEAGRISVAWLPLLLDCVMLLKVPNLEQFGFHTDCTNLTSKIHNSINFQPTFTNEMKRSKLRVILSKEMKFLNLIIFKDEPCLFTFCWDTLYNTLVTITC